jgi:hypothetical protein
VGISEVNQVSFSNLRLRLKFKKRMGPDATKMILFRSKAGILSYEMKECESWTRLICKGKGDGSKGLWKYRIILNKGAKCIGRKKSKCEISEHTESLPSPGGKGLK